MIPLRDDNPTGSQPVIAWTLLGLCVLVFFWQQSLPPSVENARIFALGVVPASLFDYGTLPPQIALVPPLMTLLTSMFLHGGWMHLIGNMLYLWIFADNIEDEMGHGRFIVFYLLCGVIAAMAQAIPDPRSEIPMIGASGAISGVLGAYLVRHPRAKVLVLIPLGFMMQLVRLPAMFVLGAWFVLQLVQSALAPPGGAGVAFGAHIGGFIAGIVLVPFFVKRPPTRPHSPWER